MAAEKFSFWKSFYESLKELPPEDFKSVICAMCERAFYDNDIELYGHLKALFTLIKPSIEKSISLSEERSRAGKQGGRPKKEKANNSIFNQTIASESNMKATKTKTETMTKTYDNEEDNNSDSSEQSSASKNKESFHKPTLLEIKAFCEEQNCRVNPEAFFDYYESNGWRVGKNPMKNWKAAVRSWEHKEQNQGSSKNSFGQCMSNGYTKSELDELEKKLIDN